MAHAVVEGRQLDDAPVESVVRGRLAEHDLRGLHQDHRHVPCERTEDEVRSLYGASLAIKIPVFNPCTTVQLPLTLAHVHMVDEHVCATLSWRVGTAPVLLTGTTEQSAVQLNSHPTHQDRTPQSCSR